MFTDFEVNNFRGFKHLDITNLARINLIAGLNNSGKTALLEALFIHAGAYNPEILLRVNSFRGLTRPEISMEPQIPGPWNSLFRNFDLDSTIEFIGRSNKRAESVKLRIVRDSNELTEIYQEFLQKQQNQTYYANRKERRSQRSEKRTSTLDTDKSTNYLSTAAHVLEVICTGGRLGKVKYYHIFDRKGQRIIPIPPAIATQSVFMPASLKPLADDIERFSLLETQKKLDDLLGILQVIEPRLKRLALAIEDGVPSIQGDIGIDRLLPLVLMGEGTYRLTSVILAIAFSRNGLVMIDEIENGFHYSVLPKVWEAISQASLQFNAQVFLSTHSLECILAAHRTFENANAYDFSFHRLEATPDGIQAVGYDKGSLSASLESHFEVR
jgi:AAA15 family ATPase/GTPase